jgi:hypothetical protein
LEVYIVADQRWAISVNDVSIAGDVIAYQAHKLLNSYQITTIETVQLQQNGLQPGRLACNQLIFFLN